MSGREGGGPEESVGSCPWAAREGASPVPASFCLHLVLKVWGICLKLWTYPGAQRWPLWNTEDCPGLVEGDLGLNSERFCKDALSY